MVHDGSATLSWLRCRSDIHSCPGLSTAASSMLDETLKVEPLAVELQTDNVGDDGAAFGAGNAPGMGLVDGRAMLPPFELPALLIRDSSNAISIRDHRSSTCCMRSCIRVRFLASNSRILVSRRVLSTSRRREATVLDVVLIGDVKEVPFRARQPCRS